MDRQPCRHPPPLLTLPHEIRAKIYAYLVPTSIDVSVAVGTSALVNTRTAVASGPGFAALTSNQLTYTSTTYRYAGHASFATNATRPALRELAMACRATRAELMPLIMTRLHPRCESFAAACGFATQLGGSLAHEVQEATVMSPFWEMTPREKAAPWADGDDLIQQNEAVAIAEAVTAWMKSTAQLLPGLRTLRVYGMPYGGEDDHLVPEWRVLDVAVREGVRDGWPGLMHATKSLVPGTRSAVTVWRADLAV